LNFNEFEFERLVEVNIGRAIEESKDGAGNWQEFSDPPPQL